MVSITLSVPEEIRNKMQSFSEINWSGFIRKIIIEKTRELEWRENLKSQLKKEEEEINRWSLDLDLKAKNIRLKELKRKGLL